MRTQSDVIRSQIQFLEYDLKLVNPDICPQFCKAVQEDIMDLRSILINIQ